MQIIQEEYLPEILHKDSRKDSDNLKQLRGQ